MSIDMNVESAYVQKAEQGPSFVQSYGQSLVAYLSDFLQDKDKGLELAEYLNSQPGIGFVKAASEYNKLQEEDNSEDTITSTESSTSDEIERNYIEVFSSSGIFARIPEDIFTFKDAEAKSAYINTATAFLNSINGYLEFSSIYANSDSFPIPNSPRYISDAVYKLIGDFKSGSTPVTGTPYVHKPMPFDPNEPWEKHSELKVTQESGEVITFDCREIRLSSGIIICEPSKAETSLDAHTIATALLGIGMLAQEYPADLNMDVMRNLYLGFLELEAKFNSVEAIRRHIEDKEFWNNYPIPINKGPALV